MKVNNFNANEKILQYQDKIHNYVHGHETLISFELDLTNKCNNRCPKCVGVKENGAELTLEQITSIVNQMHNLNVKSVVISGGGEPLMSPHFVKTLYMFKNAGISIGLNSNGLAMCNDYIRSAILDCCTYFRISLDAGTPSMYKLTHGMNEEEFWQVIDNIDELIKLRDVSDSTTSIGLGYLTGESTLSGIMDFFERADNLRVDFAQLRPFTGECADVSDYIKQGHDLFPNLTIRASTHKYDHVGEIERPYTQCHGMYFNTVITADNQMWACIHHRQNAAYHIGNLNEQSIANVLKSDRMYEVFNSLPCSSCPQFCRNDAINRALDGICRDITHKEFL
jgi:pyruvate-formate lyase-activating enzyme